MKKERFPELVVAIVGDTESGKTQLANRLCALTTEAVAYSPVMVTAGSDKLSLTPKFGSFRKEQTCVPSEQSEYYIFDSDQVCLELVTVPGRRKYWKWGDYAMTDADAAIIVVNKPSDAEIPIACLIEPLVHAMAYGISLVSVAISASSGETCDFPKIRDAVLSDIQRVFGPEVGNIPILSFENETPGQYDEIRNYLETLRAPKRNLAGPFTLSINSIHARDDCVLLGGKVLSGSVAVGDTVMLMPSAIPLKVDSIRISGDITVNVACAGQIAGLRVSGIPRNYLSCGMALVHGPVVGRSTRMIEARINFFNTNFEVKVGFSPAISILSCHVAGKLIHIENDAKSLQLGDTAVVQISLNKAVYAEIFESDRKSRFSRLVLRQENIIVGVGTVERFLD